MSDQYYLMYLRLVLDFSLDGVNFRGEPHQYPATQPNTLKGTEIQIYMVSLYYKFYKWQQQL